MKPPRKPFGFYRFQVLLACFSMALVSGFFRLVSAPPEVPYLLLVLATAIGCTYPLLAALELLAVDEFVDTPRRIYLFLASATGQVMFFGFSYHLVSLYRSSQFSHPLVGVDAWYFSAVTFATVGYGDIHPVSQGARALATAQIATGIAILTLGAARLTERPQQAARPLEAAERRSRGPMNGQPR